MKHFKSEMKPWSWLIIFLVAVVISRTNQLFWRQIFHPGQSFFLGIFFLLPVLALINEGFSRFTTYRGSLPLQVARLRHTRCLLFFLLLIIPCVVESFSRPLTLASCFLYIVSTILVFFTSGLKRGSLRTFWLDVGVVLILLLLILIAYYKFLVLEHIFFPCDSGYVYYGSNLFLGRSITQGIFPLWNPYYHLGIPVYAVPEGQSFFPVYLLAGMFSNTYGFYHYALLCFVLPQLLGAVGFYIFAKFIVRRRLIALVTAGAYALSGFTVYPSSVTYVYGMACLPWVVFFSVRAFISRKFSAGFCVGAAVSTALAIVTCYPGLWYGYLLHLLVLAIIVVIFGIRRRNRVGAVLLRLVVIWGLSGLLAAPYLFSTGKYLPLTGRAQNLEYSWAVGYNNLTPRNIYTLWFPSTSMFNPTDEARAATGLEETYRFDMANFNAQTDTYRSIYITIPCFFFALIALARWRKYRGLTLIFAGLAFGYLLLALGGHGFLYELFYYFIPFFGKARQSSIHRLFFIFYFLVLASMGMRVTFRPVRDRLTDWVARLPLAIFLVINFSLGAALLLQVIPSLIAAKETTLYSYLFHDIVYGLIFGGATFLFLLGRNIRSRFLGVGLFLLVAADALSFTYANHRFYTYRHAKYEDSLQPFIKDFGEVDNYRRQAAWNDVGWVHSFDFTVGAHALNRPQLPGYQWHRSESLSAYFDHLFKLYSEVVRCPEDKMLAAMESSRGKEAFVPEKTKYPGWFSPESWGGEYSSGELEIKWYAPNEARLAVRTSKGAFLVMADMYYPGWEAYIDGERTSVIQANFNCKGVFIPPGDHRIYFIFDPPEFRWGILLSALGFWLSLWLVGKGIAPSSARRKLESRG